ncbi:MAG: type II toxin-antitoxin system VapC family toxin [Candidatus Rokubacteria bacterium]|nr:type II toxin-antitoxin system VapC family toxin [Candidatus Rokubacteria bacterium]
MERVIFDSDLYIDWIEAGLRAELILAQQFVRYMSTVVLLELQAGALKAKAAEAVRDLYRTFERTGRLLSPSPRAFWEAGSVLRALQQRHGFDLRRRFRLVNDCLIALSSRQVGATVLTRNERDFRLIQQVAPFSLVVVP